MAQFATAYSDKPTEEAAIKEISLQIKNVIPRVADIAFVFYSPHYKPAAIKDIFRTTLRPENIIGIKTPLLIYEHKIYEQGIVAACIKCHNLFLGKDLLTNDNEEDIEVSLRETLQRVKQLKVLYGFLTPSANPSNFTKGIKWGMRKNIEMIASGYFAPYVSKNSHILNTTMGDHILYVGVGGDITISSRKIHSFIPLCRPFTFTKVDKECNLILEINNRPAAEVYRKYLQEKYELFKKKNLFVCYPLGVRENGRRYRLLSIKKILEDDSLLYFGRVSTGEEGYIMIYNQQYYLDTLITAINEVRRTFSPSLALVGNSLVKNHVLQNHVEEEVQFIKSALGEKCQVVGFYADYHITFNEILKDFIIEEGPMQVSFWQ